MAREVAPTNQFKAGAGARAGASFARGRIIEHPNFPGFVTIADAGPHAAYFVESPDHPGFVTPDSAATAPDANVMIVSGGFAIVVGS